ncbi:MAG: cupin domain-containing protein [Bacteroidota bacterium]|jgi:quercetin dioxygenase-like cupin family protein
MNITPKIFIDSTAEQWHPAGDGVERKLLGYDGDLMMMHVRFQKNAVGYIHSHPHRQVTYIETGVFEVNIGSDKKILKAGDCYFVPPDIPHGVVARENGSLVDVFTPCREDIVAAHQNKN